MATAKMSESTRVLVAVDESTGSLAAVRALHAAGYETWAAFHQAPTYSLRSRAVAGRVRVPRPEADADRYAAALAQAAERSRAAVVVPASENALRALTGRESRFPPGVVVGVCSQTALERATDKRALAEHAEAAGLMTPPSVTLGRFDEPGPALGVGLPALVKPARSVTVLETGGLRVSEVEVVDDPASLAAAVAALPGPEVVVQRHIPGRLMALTGVAWEGEVVSVCHQLAQRIWPPRAGVTCMGETVPPDLELEDRVRNLIRGVGWSGIFQTQFIRAGNESYLIDLNPRVYGSLGLAVAAGANLPAIWVDLLLGRRPRPSRTHIPTRYRVKEKDLRALAESFRAGRRLEALIGLLPRPRTVGAVVSLRDPWPASVSVEKLLARRRQLSSRQTSRAISAQSSSRGRSASSTLTPSRSDSDR